MKKSITYLLPIVVLSIICSCRHASEPADGCSLQNKLCLQTGNWWVYEAYDVDMNNQKVPNTESTDSIIVDGTEIFKGKIAYRMINYSADLSNKMKQDTFYLAIEGNMAYRMMSDITDNVITYDDTNCFCLKDKWIVFAQCSNNQWNIHQQQSNYNFYIPSNDPLDTNNQKEAIVEKIYDIKGFFSGEKEYLLNNKKFNVYNYDVNYYLHLRCLLPDNLAPFCEGYKEVTNSYKSGVQLAENIGIVTFYKDAFLICPIEKSMKNGYIKNLIRYSVK